MIILLVIVATACLLASMGTTSEGGVRPSSPPEYSVAGFLLLPGTGRDVLSANANWRYARGDISGAHLPDFDDSTWDITNLPHGLELLPANASGGINYQGPAWYRTRITLPASWTGKRIVLHFEGVMGNTQVWIDGKLVANHHGGYLPFIVNATDLLQPGRPAIVAVRADNSDDPTTPPGKQQNQLDYCYFGGIYRDVWLIATQPVHITDPNETDIPAGGGVFIRTTIDSSAQATLLIRTHIAGPPGRVSKAKLTAILRDPSGNVVAHNTHDGGDTSAGEKIIQHKLIVTNPAFWSPDSPTLYHLELRLEDENGAALDGGRMLVGLRTIEFRGRDGFWLNGRPFPDKLIGTNRHQDYGYLGNALPNSLHWRDVALLRGAGMRVIRSHYPCDPAFMDACDRLGVFVIVGTPGWQFWNPQPIFQQRVFSDVRNMVRRDRNRACLLLWEPILNETHYPAEFPKLVHDIVHEEYPHPGAYAAADAPEPGSPAGGHAMDLYYTDGRTNVHLGDKSQFRREWGDNVDDWSSQNSDARLAREQGETAQLVQATHLARPPYDYICYDDFYSTPRQVVGGCHWHSFDHQRGYHPDPFLGGICDAFRQPKYSYYLFASQRDPSIIIPGVETGPMLFVAWEMSPCSPADITVYTNCEEVRLTAFGGVPIVQYPQRKPDGMPHPPLVFRNVWSFMMLKDQHRDGRWEHAVVHVEGLIDGKVVARQSIQSPRRTSHITLSLADAGIPLVADGADIMPIVATIVDSEGSPKHFRDEDIVFTISGEGRIVGDARTRANPRRTGFGTAPLLVRSTGRAGTITVIASPRFVGPMTLQPGELTFHSVPSPIPILHPPVEPSPTRVPDTNKTALSPAEAKEAIDLVAKQQAYFETTPHTPKA